MRTRLLWLAALVCLFLCTAGCAGSRIVHLTALPVEVDIDPEATGLEGVAHAFPALRNLAGETLADGEFTQWLDGDRLHLRIRYDFGPTHWIEERSVIQQEPKLVQEQWSWMEVRDGALYRRFEVDFLSGTAMAEKLEKDGLRRWSEQVTVEPGRAFAGTAWALAIKSVRSRLVGGEAIQFQGVGFMPNPRVGTVEITHDGLDQLPMSGRTLSGDRFRIQAKIPWILRAFVEVPDSLIWLVNPPPATFLRWEGPLAEPGDEVVRVDLLSGEPSGPASPANP